MEQFVFMQGPARGGTGFQRLAAFQKKRGAPWSRQLKLENPDRLEAYPKESDEHVESSKP
jgi:hypothetical protein